MTGKNFSRNKIFLSICLGIITLFFLISCGGNDGSTSPFAEFSEIPVAGFSATPTTGPAPLTVTFDDQSTGVISTWSWDFGDGGTSTVQNPSHDYVAAGTYAVSLTVTGPGGADTDTKVDYITVTPFAEFLASPTSGNAPLTVDFTDQSGGGSITSWSWDFGDGGTSTVQNPSHAYAEGTYTVSLTVTGPDGSDTNTKVDYIAVGPPPVFTDDFNRADSSDPGPDWTVVQGEGDIQSNQLAPTVSNTKMHRNEEYGPDQYSQVKNYGTYWRSVTVRGNGIGSGYTAYAAYVNVDTGALRIGYIFGTGWGGYLDAGATNLAWNDGDVLRLEAVGQDSNIVLRVYQNGNLVKTLAWTAFSDQGQIFNSGKPGLHTLNANTVIMDDWEGGSLP